MKLRLVFVGRTRNPLFEGAIQDYLERIRRFVPCEIQEIKEGQRKGKGLPDAASAAEEKPLLSLLQESPCSVLLDVGGRELDSPAVSGFLEERMQQGLRRIDFLAAGPWGWSEAVRSRAHYRWSLSRLTLPHELARVVLLEQLFRALARLNHFPYDK